ncbi:MAG: hypothetical protein ABL874_07125, partial [Sphingopyxis sp.]
MSTDPSDAVIFTCHKRVMDSDPPPQPFRPVFGSDPLRLIVYILLTALVMGMPFALIAGAEFFP